MYTQELTEVEDNRGEGSSKDILPAVKEEKVEEEGEFGEILIDQRWRFRIPGKRKQAALGTVQPQHEPPLLSLSVGGPSVHPQPEDYHRWEEEVRDWGYEW
jgi:hypothetical protein